MLKREMHKILHWTEGEKWYGFQWFEKKILSFEYIYFIGNKIYIIHSNSGLCSNVKVQVTWNFFIELVDINNFNCNVLFNTSNHT